MRDLSATLIVGDTFGFGSAGTLGGEGQNDEGDEVGQHAIEVGADAQLSQKEYTVAIDVDTGVCGGNALEKTEEESGPGDIEGLPVTENHNGESEETEKRIMPMIST